MSEKPKSAQERLRTEMNDREDIEVTARGIGSIALAFAVGIGAFELARSGVDVRDTELAMLFATLETLTSLVATHELLLAHSMGRARERLLGVYYTELLRREGAEAISDVVVPSEPEHR